MCRRPVYGAITPIMENRMETRMQNQVGTTIQGLGLWVKHGESNGKKDGQLSKLR